MDGLDENRKHPIGWAADVVMDHIDEDENGKPTREDGREGLKPSQIASALGIGVASVYRYRDAAL